MAVIIHKAPAAVNPAPAAKEEPVVMGIDPSTNCGITILKGETTLFQGKVVAEDVPGFKRVQSIAAQVAPLLDKYKPNAVFIERPTNQGFNVILISSIGALIRREVMERGIPFYDVVPGSMKLWVTGKGNAKKKEVKAAVVSRWFNGNQKLFKGDNNVVDGYALARMGQSVLGNPAAHLKGVHRED